MCGRSQKRVLVCMQVSHCSIVAGRVWGLKRIEVGIELI